MSGPLRVIEGGRAAEPTPGLLIAGAGEVVTMTGGLRRGAEQGEIGRLAACASEHDVAQTLMVGGQQTLRVVEDRLR